MRFLMPAIAICSMCGTAIASPVQRGDVEIGVLTCGVNAPAAAEPKVEGPRAGQLRDAVCTFRPKNGPEETYFATVEGRSLTPDEGWTLIWTVNITAEMSLPGALQQSYVVDQSLPADPLSPLIGETNPNVVLHSLADRPEGSASRPQKPVPQGFIIIGLKPLNWRYLARSKARAVMRMGHASSSPKPDFCPNAIGGIFERWRSLRLRAA